MIGFTHMVFALALAYILDLPVVYAMLGSILPDTDILAAGGFPFVHRGIIHTPLFVAAVMVAVYLVTDRETVAAASGLGVLTHLYLDTFTYSGIMWLYPVTTPFSLELFAYDSVAANLGFTLLATFTALTWHYRGEVSAWLPSPGSVWLRS